MKEISIIIPTYERPNLLSFQLQKEYCYNQFLYEKDLLTANTNYYGYIQKINTLCNIDSNLLSDENIERLIPLDYSIEDFIYVIKTVVS